MSNMAMKTLPAAEAKNKFGEMIESARKAPLTIERNGRPAVVVMSPEEYDQLVSAQDGLWEARAIEIEEKGDFLNHEDSMAVLRQFLPRLV